MTYLLATRAARGLLASCGAAVAAACAFAFAPATQAKTKSSVKISGPGVTARQIRIANVSDITGAVPGLFLGSQLGTEAYAAYVNSKGGIDGHHLVVDAEDDAFTCTGNQARVKGSLTKDFAFVGQTSVFDPCGAALLKQHSTIPDVSYTFDPTTGALPNFFSGAPYSNSVATGQLLYLKQKYPSAIKTVGELYGANVQSQIQLQVSAMQSLGYKVIYQDAVQSGTITPQNAVPEIVRMRAAGVNFVSLTAINDTGIAAFLNAAQQQGWSPSVVWNTGTAYDSTFAGEIDPGAAKNLVITSNLAPFRAGQNSSDPGVRLFVKWLHKVKPGYTPDVWSAYSWSSTALFVDALEHAGPHVTRASVLAALKKIHHWSANGLSAPDNPGSRQPTECFDALVYNGSTFGGGFQQVNKPKHGYFQCSGKLFFPSSH